MDFSDLITQDIRLCILQILQQDPGYSCNESILQSAMGALTGHKVSRDKVRTELDWLAEQGFVSVEDVVGIKVARLTQRGDDVAAGRLITAGVRRPTPGECRL
jgi:Fe2+ or Zn2+ uptake regulation protein